MTVPGGLMALFSAGVIDFPEILGYNDYASTNNDSVHVVSLDATASAGEMIVILVSQDTTGNIDMTDGGLYTELGEWNGTGVRIGAAWGTAAGGETDVTINVSTNNIVVRLYRIAGGGTPSIATASTANTSKAPNPPNLDPAAGTKKYLWLAFFGCDTNNHNPALTTYPTGYSNTANYVSTDAGVNCGAGFADRALEASSEDPAAFGVNVNSNWAATTLGIPPA